MENYKKLQWSDLDEAQKNIADVEFNKVDAKY